MSSQKLKNAMILAAGFGTRLKPVTDKIPKALIPFEGKPMVQNVIEKLIGFGIERIVINTHYLSEQVDFFFASNKFEAEIILVHENEILGTGGGIKNAEKYLNTSAEFLVYNVDVDSEINLGNFYMDFLKRKSIAALAVKNRQSSRYLLTDTDLNVIGRTENGKETKYRNFSGSLLNFAFCGVHILSGRVFDYLPRGIYFDIIPSYMQMIENGEIITAYDIGDISWKDLGKK